jgi:hypothetical protein
MTVRNLVKNGSLRTDRLEIIEARSSDQESTDDSVTDAGGHAAFMADGAELAHPELVNCQANPKVAKESSAALPRLFPNDD